MDPKESNAPPVEGEKEAPAEGDHVMSALFDVAEARCCVAEIVKGIGELVAQKRELNDALNAEGECEQLSGQLDEEKREHQEKLRQINQDINYLHDVLRTAKAECGQRRVELVERREANWYHQVPQVGQCSSSSVPSPDSPQTQLVLQFLHVLQWFIHQQNAAAILAESIMANAAVPIQPRQKMAPSSGVNVNQAKMKLCLHCFQSIHRNAPTCPHCKQKITSKASKRIQKK